MIITVQQRQVALSSEYEIETPECIYEAKKKWPSWRDKVTLFAPRGRIVARITGRPSFFRAKYDFELADGTVYHLREERVWKGVFVCRSPNESFCLYQHKGLNFSIFKSDLQIAAFSKNPVTVGVADRYEIRMNDDANPIVVICLVLATDLFESEDNSSTATYDFGNIGPEDRKFDRSWEPS